MKPSFKILVFLSGILLSISGCSGINYNTLTGKENLTFISEEKEVKLGKKLSRRVEEEYEIIQDPRVKDIVKETGYKLIEKCDRKGIVYYFEAIKRKKDNDKEEPNAFALPGGYIYINDKLLNLISQDSKDEIAAILAHEISHIVLRHNILRLQEAIGMQALLVVIGITADDASTLGKSNLALILLMLAYTKEREMEADRLALRYMQNAGYDPRAMISVFEKIREYQFSSPIRAYHIKTHPYMDERIEAIEREISTGELFKNSN